jgi:ubiquitin-activating enzyme E1
MVKLTSMRVLLVGMRGVGVEVAKNAILAGVNSLIIFDTTPTQV